MAYGYPGATNTFIPTLDHSGNLQVGYSRNVDKFAVNKIAKLTPTSKMRGQYLYFNPLDLARIPGGDVKQSIWAPGTPRPTGLNNTLGFEMREFTCDQYVSNSSLPQQAVDQAEWGIVKSHTEALAQEAMTRRALLVSTVLTTTGNYATGHYDTAASWGGGAWDSGTTEAPYILRGMNAMAQKIQVDTVGRLNYKNLSLVVNPNTARKMAQSREIHEYLMQSPSALSQVRGGDKNQNAVYGLPPELYGVTLVIEDAVYNDDNKLASSAAPTYVLADAKAVMLLRDEGLEAPEGGMSFNAVHLFAYEDMVVEAREDQWNRLVQLSVVDTVVAKMVSPVSACLATSVVS